MRERECPKKASGHGIGESLDFQVVYFLRSLERTRSPREAKWREFVLGVDQLLILLILAAAFYRNANPVIFFVFPPVLKFQKYKVKNSLPCFSLLFFPIPF